MKYVSIDIETGGLDRKCSLLEFGAVIDDLTELKQISELPTFHAYIVNDLIVGEPYALAMHQTILKRITNRDKEPSYTFIQPEDLEVAFFNFLCKHHVCGPENGSEITVAGKNFAMFDKDWLQPLFSNGFVKFHRRVMDPSIFYLNITEDKTLPDSKTCMERANLPGEVAHTAVDDAKMVIRLIRHNLLFKLTKSEKQRYL